jgi:3alpha(or 20beta)-hydroxysteroid dehydrogenase
MRVIRGDIGFANTDLAADGSLHLDVGREADWDRLADLLRGQGRPIDILVNAAGISAGADPVDTVSVADWDKTIRVNQTGVMLGIRTAINLKPEDRSLAIVNIASIWGSVATTDLSAYHASKGAVVNLTKNVAVTYAMRGIRANAVLPGLIDTDMIKGHDSRNDHTISLTPMRRVGSVEEVASAVAFLASDEASYITGACLAVDGGYLAQ